MRWPWQTRFIVLDQPLLEEKELAGAFAVAETDIRHRAIIQLIGELERDANEAAQKTVASPGISASSNGGAEHLAILRDRIIALQQKGFGRIGSERNQAE